MTQLNEIDTDDVHDEATSIDNNEEIIEDISAADYNSDSSEEYDLPNDDGSLYIVSDGSLSVSSTDD